MENVLERLPLGARVAVVRLRSLGDCVLTTPALEILKHARPDLEVAVAVEDRFAAVFEGNPDVARVLAPRAGELRRWRPELCLNLHGGPRSLSLTAASGARIRAGFAHFRGSCVYNLRIPTAQEILGVSRKVHTAEHLASAVFHLGEPVREVPRARLFTKSPGQRPGPPAYAVIHPAATAPDKTWPAEGFLAVAAYLRKTWELEPVFIAGPGDDLAPFRDYRSIAGAPLAEIKSLVCGASLFLGNDSGPAHIAAAFQVPVAVIFGPSDPLIWGPWRTPGEILVADGPISSVSAAEVIQAVDRLLKVPA